MAPTRGEPHRRCPPSADFVEWNIENVIIETEIGFTPYEALLHATATRAGC